MESSGLCKNVYFITFINTSREVWRKWRMKSESESTKLRVWEHSKEDYCMYALLWIAIELSFLGLSFECE